MPKKDKINGAKRAVIAFGGNAISNRDKEDTIPNQFVNTYNSLGPIVELIKSGYQLALTHGNGPQVGNAILRVELARGKAPILPLYICDADLQGGMGYMIAQCLQNRLKDEGINREVVTIVSQVLVDENDPAFKNPTKFIGQFYTKEKAEKLKVEMGWDAVAQFPNDDRWRRVVPSPKPISLVEGATVKKLVHGGTIVIATGGGGIPVIRKEGRLVGVDAVIDKDYAAAVMAREIEAELLIILTEVEKVSLNYGQPNQSDLGDVTLSEIKKYYDQGHFPPGSMGPKIQAAIKFLSNGGKKVIITSLERGFQAVVGEAGTRITR
jgi:carbamate kinase